MHPKGCTLILAAAVVVARFWVQVGVALMPAKTLTRKAKTSAKKSVRKKAVRKKSVAQTEIAAAPILLADAANIRSLLDGAKIPGEPYSHHHVTWESFEEWAKTAEGISDPDKMRLAVYYGFQPLFDALIEMNVSGEQRSKALEALDQMVGSGIRYLTSYYTGRPDPSLFQSAIGGIKSLLPNAVYRTKFRNVDYNGISAKDILLFLRTFVSLVEKGTVQRPDIIVGCACGSAEIVMPLAGILGAQLEFIRRSHRRGDSDGRIIEEHGERLKTFKGKHVLVIEDYVCTGESLGIVMAKVLKQGAASVKGASINSTSEHKSNVVVESSAKKCHIFNLKG